MAKIRIMGTIVPNDYKWIYDLFEIDSTCPRDVTSVLDKLSGEEVEVEINSGGGDVYSGSEIYTALKSYAGKVVVKIVGVAASAASVAAMAGDVVQISPTAQIMIHNVSEGVYGDYRLLEHEAAVLKNYNISIANAYQLKTGMSQEKLLELMNAGGSANRGTWLNAQQAKELGFADEIMFDDGNRLVASIGTAVMIPPQIINKIRNLFPKKPEGKNDEAAAESERLRLLVLRKGGVFQK